MENAYALAMKIADEVIRDEILSQNPHYRKRWGDHSLEDIKSDIPKSGYNVSVNEKLHQKIFQCSYEVLTQEKSPSNG